MDKPVDRRETLALIDSALRDWPHGYSAMLAALMFDEAMIARLDELPAADIHAFQSARCDMLMGHVRTSSRLWAERAPDASTAAWNDWPILGKEEYRLIAAAGSLPVSEDRSPVARNATSGSSGAPVQFYACALTRRHASAQALHNWRRQGLDMSRTMAMITHKVLEHPGEHRLTSAHADHRRGLLYQRRARQFSVEAHARWLSQIGADYLVTVPSILRGMLDIYELEGSTPPIALVLTYAESVEPELRSRAAAILGAEIRDCYGCEEIGPLAYQCPSSGERYHVAAANVFVEIVDENDRACAEGAIGRVIATGLNNFATPAIRYELGDLAACRWGCPCGFEGQVIEQLLGRARFLLRMPSGERRHPGTFARSWLEIAPIRERRLVQTAPNVVQAEVVLDRPITQGEREKIAAMLGREISDELVYEVVQVEAIAWGPTFKRQDVVCLI